MSIRHRLSAFRDLVSHYKNVFKHFWQQRNLLKNGLLNEHEAEFLPPALALQEKPVSSTARITAFILMLLVFVALLWAILGHVDIIVNGTGKIIPSGRIKTIASVDVASVMALHVAEGQQVKAGDVLIELDPRENDAIKDKALGDESEGVFEVARAKALIAAIDSGRSPQLPPLSNLQSASHTKINPEKWQTEQEHVNGLFRDFQAKLHRIDGDITRYGEALPLATQRANDYQTLLKDHDVAQHAWLEKEQARVDLEGQLNDAKNQHTALITETKHSAYDQLTEGSRLAASSQQDAIRSDSHGKLLRLVAPVDGTIQQLTVHTIGGVVPSAQPLMQIVPMDNNVEVEAFLDSKDIGFVKEGQSAQVKIDAFEYVKYGTIPATVVHVSRDAIQDDKDEKKELRYTIKVMLSQSTMSVDGTLMRLTPGMSASVEIKTGDRRIIEYVLSPLIEHQHEALHER